MGLKRLRVLNLYQNRPYNFNLLQRIGECTMLDFAPKLISFTAKHTNILAIFVMGISYVRCARQYTNLESILLNRKI